MTFHTKVREERETYLRAVYDCYPDGVWRTIDLPNGWTREQAQKVGISAHEFHMVTQILRSTYYIIRVDLQEYGNQVRWKKNPRKKPPHPQKVLNGRSGPRCMDVHPRKVGSQEEPIYCWRPEGHDGLHKGGGKTWGIEEPEQDDQEDLCLHETRRDGEVVKCQEWKGHEGPHRGGGLVWDEAKLYRCASPNCPGYTWRASERAHPSSTCGSSIKKEPEKKAIRKGGWVTIHGCARCGEDHLDPILTAPFTRPVDDHGLHFTWWTICPNTQEPILGRVCTEEERNIFIQEKKEPHTQSASPVAWRWKDESHRKWSYRENYPEDLEHRDGFLAEALFLEAQEKEEDPLLCTPERGRIGHWWKQVSEKWMCCRECGKSQPVPKGKPLAEVLFQDEDLTMPEDETVTGISGLGFKGLPDPTMPEDEEPTKVGVKEKLEEVVGAFQDAGVIARKETIEGFSPQLQEEVLTHHISHWEIRRSGWGDVGAPVYVAHWTYPGRDGSMNLSGEAEFTLLRYFEQVMDSRKEMGLELGSLKRWIRGLEMTHLDMKRVDLDIRRKVEEWQAAVSKLKEVYVVSATFQTGENGVLGVRFSQAEAEDWVDAMTKNPDDYYDSAAELLGMSNLEVRKYRTG